MTCHVKLSSFSRFYIARTNIAIASNAIMQQFSHTPDFFSQKLSTFMCTR